MKISSTYLAPKILTQDESIQLGVPPEAGEKGVQLMTFSTFVNEKQILTGATVGLLQNGQPLLRPVGQSVLEHLVEHLNLNFPDGRLIISEVKSVSNAKKRTIKSLKDSQSGDAVVFLCADDRVYDEVVKSLHVDYPLIKKSTQ